MRLLVLLALLPLSGCSERRTPQAPPPKEAPPATEAPKTEQAPSGQKARAPRHSSTVVLDGERTTVEWSDGDTFRIRSGEHQGVNARLHGYNTLEDYGPVHRWGGWTHQELLENAHASGELVRPREWECRSVGEKDRYGRLLVACPEAGLELVREGLAIIFSVEGPSPEPWQKAQAEARQARRGMWKKGTPKEVVTSLHSLAEGRGYNRVVDAQTGHARIQPHSQTYAVCEEVCVGEGEDASCMVYVPFERRYRDRPDCLQR